MNLRDRLRRYLKMKNACFTYSSLEIVYFPCSESYAKELKRSVMTKKNVENTNIVCYEDIEVARYHVRK